MKAYSQDLRDRVLGASERGEHPQSIAERLEVSRGWVDSVVKRYQQSGIRTALKMGGHITPRLEPLEETLRQWIREEPDLTLEALTERLEQCYEIHISVSGLWYQLDRWEITLKKKPSTLKSKRVQTWLRNAPIGRLISHKCRPITWFFWMRPP